MDPSSGFEATGISKSELKNQELVVGASGFEPEASCAQGRRATRLRYAPTCTACLILKHLPTLLLIRTVAFTPNCARTAYESVIASLLCALAQPSESERLPAPIRQLDD
jgi:hypothetical protein